MKTGVFDSGMGGLTILKALCNYTNDYDYLYLGDNGRTPYGTRSFETILKFTQEAVEYLFKQDCKVIIIACNTASAKALRTIQQKYLPQHYPDRRILGVIRPSTEQIADFSKTKRVAIWATPGTVKSESYLIEIGNFSPDCLVVQQACPMLVPLIENGELNNEACDYFIKKYWEQTDSQLDNIDTLLLACTHYSILYDQIKACLPSGIKIIEQGSLVGPSWKDYLSRHPEIETQLSRNQTKTFLTTDQVDNFNSLACMFLGYPVKAQKIEL
ncbi:MAG: glutamate racemase [Fibrobacteria bacterium]|nr:glutamate racemase [Fibrobacteria bacterium]